MEIIIGKVLRTKNLDGSLVIYLFSDKLLCQKDDILFFEKQFQKFGPYNVTNNQFYKFYNNQKIYILKLKEIDSFEKAKSLRSAYIIKNYDFLPENIFIKNDLIKSKVVIKDSNKIIGEIVDAIRVKNNYYLLLVKSFHKGEIFIPFIKEIIHSVNVSEKFVYVNLIDGVTDVI